MLGAVRYTDPDDLKRDLDWIEAHLDGKPYGLDVVMPAKKVEAPGNRPLTEADVEAMIPEGHRQFVQDTLAKHGVPELAAGEASGRRITGWTEQVARTQPRSRLRLSDTAARQRPRLTARRPGAASGPK